MRHCLLLLMLISACSESVDESTESQTRTDVTPTTVEDAESKDTTSGPQIPSPECASGTLATCDCGDAVAIALCLASEVTCSCAEVGNNWQPCEQSTQCDSGLCVAFPGGNKRCTRNCYDGCPAATACADIAPGTDTAPVCVPSPAWTCAPCTTDDDCAAGWPEFQCASLPNGALGCLPAGGAACPARIADPKPAKDSGPSCPSGTSATCDCPFGVAWTGCASGAMACGCHQCSNDFDCPGDETCRTSIDGVRSCQPCESDALCACQIDSDCDTLVCVAASPRHRICAPFCADCPDNFRCEVLTLPSRDIHTVCVPNNPLGCAPCETNSDCVGHPNIAETDQRCIESGDRKLCAPSCLADTCPDGWICDRNRTEAVCVPQDGTCPPT